MKIFIAIIVTMAMVGCGGTVMYSKSGATTQEFEYDKWGCEMAARQYAASFSTPTPTYTLGASMGTAIGSGIAEGLIMREAFDKCMRARGWIPQN